MNVYAGQETRCELCNRFYLIQRPLRYKGKWRTKVKIRFDIISWLIVVGLSSVLSLGCKDQPGTTETTSSSSTKSQLPVDVPRQDVFVVDQIFRYSIVENFNLWMPGPPSPTRQGLIMDTLWYIDQETGEQINALASQAPVYNEDFTQMTVKLRPSVYWSDGVEFTADDLVFTCLLYTSPSPRDRG